MSETKRPGEMLSKREYTAIRLANEHGPKLAADHPEIEDDVRNGLTAAQIAEKYEVAKTYGVTDEIGRSVATIAIQTLLSAEERRKIYEPIERVRNVQIGYRTYLEGIGVHGLTTEQRRNNALNNGLTAEQSKEFGKKGFEMRDKVEHREASRRGGFTNGPRMKAEGKGIFALTHEERLAAVRASHKARGDGWFGGKVVDGMEEGEYAHYLSTQNEFQLQKGANYPGSPDYTKIAAAVNEKFGNNRSRGATKGFFEHEKQRKKSKEE